MAREAIEADPTKPYLRTGLPLSLIRAGEYREALTTSEGNAALTALIHAHNGDPGEARKWLQTARDQINENPLDPRSSWHPAQRMKWQFWLRETEKKLAKQ